MQRVIGSNSVTGGPEALYSSGGDVGIHRSSHSARKEDRVNVNFLKVSTKKTSKIFFNTTFIVLFRNYFTKVSHSTLTVNAT